MADIRQVSITVERLPGMTDDDERWLVAGMSQVLADRDIEVVGGRTTPHLMIQFIEAKDETAPDRLPW